MPQYPISLRNPYLAALLAWLCPGMGHFYQGRTAKGCLYAICILSLYFVGFAMGEGKIVYWRWVSPFGSPEQFSLYYVGQFFVGLPALPALIQGTLQYYGITLTGTWGFMSPPDPHVINALHRPLGKLVEVGTIYTTVAGLLNVLAIYDAFEGPAYADLDDEEVAEAAPASKAGPVTSLKAEGQA